MAAFVSNHSFGKTQNQPRQGFLKLLPALGTWRVHIFNQPHKMPHEKPLN
jgi:hypothetical protein